METGRVAANQKAAVKYIQHLAECTGTDIEGWDIPSLFGKESGGIHTDKRKLNQIFFAAIEGKINAKETKRSVLPISVFSGLNKCLPLKQEIEKKEVEIENYLSDIYQMSTRIDSNFQTISKKRAEIATMTGEKIMLGNALEKALQGNNFFEFFMPVMLNDSITGVLLKTKSFIVRHKNEAANVNQSLSFPRLYVYLDTKLAVRIISPWAGQFFHHLAEGSLNLNELGNFIDGGGSFVWHPHVKNNVMCLGNMSGNMADYIRALDVPKILQLTESILKTYYAGNPYVSLEALIERHRHIKELTQDVSSVGDYGHRENDGGYAYKYDLLSDMNISNIDHYLASQDQEGPHKDYNITIDKECSL